MRLNLRVLGVDSWMGGDGGSSSGTFSEALATPLDAGRPPSSDTAMRPAPGFSPDVSSRVSLSPRLKKLAGSRVLLRLRSRSLRPGRRALRGIFSLASSSSTRTGNHSAVHGTASGGGRGEVVPGPWTGRKAEEALLGLLGEVGCE